MSLADLLRAGRRALRAACIAYVPLAFARWCEPDDRELGAWGEEIAARHLAQRGYRLLGRRVKTVSGEVDILARDAHVLVCVEVKTARSAPVPRPRGHLATGPGLALRWRPGGRCGPDQLRRLQRIARDLSHAVRHPASLREVPGRRARTMGGRGDGRGDGRGAGWAAWRVDLVEVFLDTARRRPHVIHHPDLDQPLDEKGRLHSQGRGA